jgi:hypothetical protein
MKVFILPPGEDWIVDRFVKEWYSDNAEISTYNVLEADVIWLLADWCWNQLPYDLLRSKHVITTVHHIVPEKFSEKERQDFQKRDQVTDLYHVYNEKTFEFVKSLTSKNIKLVHYWANQNIWKKTGSKSSLRLKYDLPADKFLIGSFQRDTEGFDLISPKLEKGPDLFVDFVEHKSSISVPRDIHVVLAGWRRQYVIKRLQDAKISFSYFERPSHEVINDLYQCLDLYPISARCEGGPQALIECGLLRVPVVSRDVGISRQVLPDTAINNDLRLAEPEIPHVTDWLLPLGYKPYIEMINLLTP